MEAIELFNKVFPHVKLSIFQQELIEDSIDDLDKWKEALTFWAGNDYRGQSVFKIITYYKEQKDAVGNKSNPKSNIGTLQQSADYFERKYGPVN